MRRALLLGLLLGGCALSYNYSEPNEPRYAGSFAAPPPSAAPRSIRVVSFNIQFAEHITRATNLLDLDPRLADADILLLQEMDAPGVLAIAERLGLNYVYYPAVIHPKGERDFGNAVLSRWPIVDDAKIILPHHARFDGSQRTATAATVQIGETAVRVYSLHLATPIDLGEGDRRDQARAVVSDVDVSVPTIIGGDFNDRDMAELVARRGFDWATQGVGKTSRWSSVDHLLAHGLTPEAAGKVRKNRDASDHFPVWAELALSD